MVVEERVSELFLKHQTMLMEYIRTLIHNPNDSEDVSQQVGIIILSKAQVPDDPEVFPRWARGVARNEVLHYWRAQKRARVIPDSRLVAAVDRAFEEADAESDLTAARRKALDDCLAAVGGKTREVLSMRYVRGLSCAQIARLITKTATAVRVMLMRARDSLTQCIEARLREEEVS